jgi:hypothetical protein
VWNYNKIRVSTQLGILNPHRYVKSDARRENPFLVVQRYWRGPIFLWRARHKNHEAGGSRVRRILASILPILETVGAFAAIILIQRLIELPPSDQVPQFARELEILGALPHPFWLVVVFIPLLYGSTLGLFAGSMAFGLHLAIRTSQISNCLLCPPDLLTPADLITPAMMLFVAVCVGALRQRSISRHSELTDRTRDLNETLAVLTKRLDQSEKACGILQQRIRRETLTFASLYELSNSLDVLEEAQVWQGTADVAAKLIGAASVSVWAYQDGGLHIRATCPKDAGSSITNDCLNTSPVLRQCLEDGKTVSIRDVVSSMASYEPPGVPVMIAAPLLARDGKVTGFIIVEKLHFSHLIPTAVTSTAILANWASRSLQDAQLFREMSDIGVRNDLAAALRGNSDSDVSHQQVTRDLAAALEYSAD